MKANPEALKELVTAAFAGAGCGPDEARAIGDHLVEANLAGHDSHALRRRYSWRTDALPVA